MSANLYVGDAVTIVRLAYDLYEKGQEAYDAPASFRELLEDLRIIKEILWGIQARLRRDQSTEDELTARVLQRCNNALLSFKPIVQKYRRLADTDHGLWLKRISWALDQKDIEKCHKKFESAARILHLLLISAQRRDTAESSRALLEELEVESTPTQNPKEEHDSGVAVSRTSTPRPASESSAEFAGQRGQITVDEGKHISFRTNYKSAGRPHMAVPPAVELGIGNQASSWLWYPASSTTTNRFDHINYHVGIVFTPEQPHSMKLLENRKRHELKGPLYAGFKRSSEYFDHGVDADAWLYHATWWLLKSRAVWSILSEQQEQNHKIKSGPHTWKTGISKTQALIDLYKSSFILEDIVLAKDPMGTNMNDSTWKSLKNLSAAIDQEFRDRGNGSTLQESNEHEYLQQDLDFRESWMSPAEDPQRVPYNFDNLCSPRRWLKADMTDAGMTNEKVLYHTFVDAELGTKEISMKSSSAPYLLLLSCQTGRSEIIISLCNLAFTVNLSRSLKLKDLKRLEESTRLDGGIEFEFPSQRVVIKFLSDAEHTTFLSHPQKFFATIKDRGPRPGEVLVMREALQSYQSRDAIVDINATSQKRGMNDSHAACEFSLYDFCPEEAWKTTRRLVISSDPSTTKPWCTSHWLPLSRIQVQVQAHEVVLRWSDYKQLEEKSNGEYGVWYSYLYKPNNPNCSVNLAFADSDVALAFVDAILRPFDTPFKLQYAELLHTFESTAQSGQLYRLCDLNEASNKGRHAIITIKKRPNYLQVTDVFFVHRDFDFMIESTTKHFVKFPELEVPDYISSIRGVARSPDEDSEEPEFADVEVAQDSLRVEFSSSKEMFRFMGSLLGWNIAYCRRVRHISLDHKWSLSSNTHTKAIVYVLGKKHEQDQRHTVRLAMRAVRDSEPYWVTASPPEPYLYGSKITLKNVKIEKGKEIDSKKLAAIDPVSRAQQQSNAERKITIVFETNQDAELFAKHTRSALDDWNLGE